MKLRTRAEWGGEGLTRVRGKEREREKERERTPVHDSPPMCFRYLSRLRVSTHFQSRAIEVIATSTASSATTTSGSSSSPAAAAVPVGVGVVATSAATDTVADVPGVVADADSVTMGSTSDGLSASDVDDPRLGEMGEGAKDEEAGAEEAKVTEAFGPAAADGVSPAPFVVALDTSTSVTASCPADVTSRQPWSSAALASLQLLALSRAGAANGEWCGWMIEPLPGLAQGCGCWARPEPSLVHRRTIGGCRVGLLGIESCRFDSASGEAPSQPPAAARKRLGSMDPRLACWRSMSSRVKVGGTVEPSAGPRRPNLPCRTAIAATASFMRSLRSRRCSSPGDSLC